MYTDSGVISAVEPLPMNWATGSRIDSERLKGIIQQELIFHPFISHYFVDLATHFYPKYPL